jgi:hypothetical protein
MQEFEQRTCRVAFGRASHVSFLLRLLSCVHLPGTDPRDCRQHRRSEHKLSYHGDFLQLMVEQCRIPRFMQESHTSSAA